MRFSEIDATLVLDAPAKLNLYLDVLGRRPDGYHELDTVMVSVGLYDTLRFRPLPVDVRLTCDLAGGPAAVPLSTGEDNLVVRAARLMQRETGTNRGAEIHLVKRIPMQAGMGGGSSDAAATLVGLNRLWGLGLASAELHRLAAQLGSDVNFFLDSVPAALCRGRGEQIEPHFLSRPLDLVIVKPAEGLSTAEVFRAWKSIEETSGRGLPERPGGLPVQEPGPAGGDAMIQALRGRSSVDVLRRLWNSLERPACRLSPAVSRTLESLRNVCRSGVLMTGSGTACFAVCRNRSHALAVAGGARQARLGQVYAVRTAT